MATAAFSIHEDIENMVPARIHARKPAGFYKEKLVERSKKDHLDRENRGAFQPLTNLSLVAQPQDVKRIKLSERQAGPMQIKQNEMKKEMKQKLDSGVLKVDQVCPKKKNIAESDAIVTIYSSEQEEYIQDIWNYLVYLEHNMGLAKSSYMSKQMNLTWKMRCILVDWLACVADEYNMSEQTLHLAVNYIDKFLSQISVVKEKFQLVGAAAMMVAAKVEEIYPPETAEWAYLTGDTYSTKQLLKMEQLVLKVLRFRVQPPTMFTFIQHLCTEHQLDVKTMYLAMYISELVLLDGEDYLNHVPSKLAAASIALARLTLRKAEAWTKPLSKSTGYTLRELSPVVQKQQKTFVDSPLKESQAIQNKYKTEKYYKVALLKPTILDLDDVEDDDIIEA